MRTMKEHVIDVIAEVVEMSPCMIYGHDNLENDLEIDSLELIDLQIELDIEFDIVTDEWDFELLEDVDDVVEYITLLCKSGRV